MGKKVSYISLYEHGLILDKHEIEVMELKHQIIKSNDESKHYKTLINDNKESIALLKTVILRL